MRNGVVKLVPSIQAAGLARAYQPVHLGNHLICGAVCEASRLLNRRVAALQ